MNKVMLFGNAGGRKSTLGLLLAEQFQLPLYSIDQLQWRDGGEPVSPKEYLEKHKQILTEPRWVLDGFGDMETFQTRLQMADTIIFIDLPINVHYLWVFKRMLQSIRQEPVGWPSNSPVIRSGFKHLGFMWRVHRDYTPKFRQMLLKYKDQATVVHLTSVQALNEYRQQLATEVS